MSNGENGKNGKEIDRLLKLIDAIARVDEKLDALNEQYKIDCNNTKERINSIAAQLNDLEKRRSDLIHQVDDNANQIVKMQEGISRWKIYWGAIAFVVSPTLTTLIIYLFEHFILHAI
jgi:chromosome segregation ATPase